MTFTDPAFAAFLPAALALWWLFRRWERGRVALLLAASLFFYAWRPTSTGCSPPSPAPPGGTRPP